VLVALFMAVSVPASAQVKERAPSDLSRLDSYLERLGLDRLRIRHLERELQRASPNSTSSAIAGRLAEVYAERMLTVTDPKELAELTARLTQLIGSHPAAGTARVRLTLLEGDYNRAEAQALKWVGDPSDEPARADALARLARCRPELDRTRDELLKQVQILDNRADHLEGGSRRDAVELELRATAQTASRAIYFAAWANYYDGLLAPADRAAGFGVARKGFRRLLELDEDQLKPDEIAGLDVELNARIALGLALAEIFDGHPENSEVAFQALRSPSVPAAVRDWVDRWQVWALLKKQLNDEAETIARAAVERLTPPYTPAKAALCSVLIRAVPGGTAGGAGTPPAANRDRANRLAFLGIQGFIRLGRPDLARRLIGDRDLSARAQTGAIAHWLRGQAALRTAEAAQGTEGYTEALAWFTAALGVSDPPADPAVKADCLFGQAWCLYRLGETARARDDFREVASQLTALGLPAADAEWMALVTAWSLAEDTPAARLERITREAQAFRQSHPDHPGAAQADELVARLKRELASPEELTREPSKNAATQVAIARKLHGRWVELGAADRVKSPLSKSLATTVGDALPQVDAAKSPIERLHLLLIAADLALAADPPDRDRARVLVDEAGTILAKRPPPDPLAAEVRLRRFQLARADKDRQAIREHARWLIENAGARFHERACLTSLAELADEDVHAATAADRPARAAEALEIHRKLASAIADFPDRIKSNPTLRLVYLRIVRYGLDAGKPEVALRYASLLKLAKPQDPEVVLLNGLANSAAGHHDRALECWHELLERLPSDSSSWFEAKFHQIEELIRVDAGRARRAWEQFQILHPDMGPEPWPERFRELAKQIR
jgi:tetratricopeptide (TPR) repeat protein